MTPRRVLVGGWLLFLLYAFPGYLMQDGADQLVDSRYGQFTDWHSPMMTEVWRLIEYVIGGPAGMLFLQSLLIVSGSYAVARRLVGNRAGAWVAVAVLLVPPLIATNAVICGEAQLVAWLVAGLALLQSERFGRRLLGLGVLVIAVGMHSGGAAAALPIIASSFTWRTPLAGWRRAAVAVGAWVTVVAFAAGLNYVLVDNRTEREEVRAAMQDIIGTLDRAPSLDDRRALDLLGSSHVAVQDGIQARARSIDGKEQSYAAGDNRLFESPANDEERDALYVARRALIRAYPAAYLSHRWHTFTRTLGLKRPGSWNPVYTEFVASQSDSEALHHASRHALVQRMLIAPVRALRNTFVFRPIYYLGLAFVLVGIAIWRRQRLALVLLASGLLFELALAFTITRSEYRSSHPMTALTLLAGFLLAANASGTASQARNEGVGDKTAVRRADDDDVHARDRRA